jgi:acyl-CoA dehydrogenase
VNTELPQHISDFASVARARLQRVGGPQAALRAETEERPREQAAAALAELGATELDVRVVGDVRAGGDDALAAAVLCQAAGAVALPYPVVEDLLAIDGARLALVNPAAPRIDHGDLPGQWVAADLDGQRYGVQPGVRGGGKLGPFLVPATLSPSAGAVAPADIDLHLVLGSWRILGAMQRCLQIVCDHVNARAQFGKPLSAFQAVRFSVADATVAVAGLYELAKYTMSRFGAVEPAVRNADALVLRLKAVDTAVAVLRTAHQLLGALGFCDESDISVIDRHTQPLLRLPLNGADIAVRLSSDVRDGHLETLFSGSA